MKRIHFSIAAYFIASLMLEGLTAHADDTASEEAEELRTEPYSFVSEGVINAVTGSYENSLLGIAIPNVTAKFTVSTHAQLVAGMKDDISSGKIKVPEGEEVYALTAFIDTFLNLKLADNTLNIQFFAFEPVECGGDSMKWAQMQQEMDKKMMDGTRMAQKLVETTKIKEAAMAGKDYVTYTNYSEVSKPDGSVVAVGNANIATENNGKVIVCRAFFSNDEMRDGLIRNVTGLIGSIEYSDLGQDGADQPATAPELKPEGEDKPKPESEVRSQ